MQGTVSGIKHTAFAESRVRAKGKPFGNPCDTKCDVLTAYRVFYTKKATDTLSAALTTP